MYSLHKAENEELKKNTTKELKSKFEFLCIFPVLKSQHSNSLSIFF